MVKMGQNRILHGENPISRTSRLLATGRAKRVAIRIESKVPDGRTRRYKCDRYFFADTREYRIIDRYPIFRRFLGNGGK